MYVIEDVEGLKGQYLLLYSPCGTFEKTSRSFLDVKQANRWIKQNLKNKPNYSYRLFFVIVERDCKKRGVKK